MTNPSKGYKNRPILTDKELSEMLNKADQITEDYFKLRVKALIALLKKFGKRRLEISTLKISDLKIEKGYLYVTFTIVKKHKKGLFQYLKFLKKTDPEALNKPHVQLEADWKSWRETELGHTRKEELRTKRVSIKDKYARMILEYLSFLHEKHEGVMYLFPSGKTVFGHTYVLFNGKHLSGRQLLRLIKPLNAEVWLHLFRETKGAEIAREEGNRLNAVYEVRDSLDLENEETAYRYVRRYAVQEVKAET